MKSAIEERLAMQVRASKLPEPQREFRFHPDRRWRVDFAWPDALLLVECEGGAWVAGRHTRGAGFEGDCEKYNAATLMGFKVLRFTGAMVKSGQAIVAICKALGR